MSVNLSRDGVANPSIPISCVLLHHDNHGQPCLGYVCPTELSRKNTQLSGVAVIEDGMDLEVDFNEVTYTKTSGLIIEGSTWYIDVDPDSFVAKKSLLDPYFNVTLSIYDQNHQLLETKVFEDHVCVVVD